MVSQKKGGFGFYSQKENTSALRNGKVEIASIMDGFHSTSQIPS